MPSALDASAMVALVRDEPGADRVIDALTEPGERSFAHFVNLCEVYYTTCRRHGEEEAAGVIRALVEGAGIVPYESPDPEFYWEVGRLRAFATSQRLAISLADCFCIAMARALGAEVLTCDHQEFEPMAGLGLCAVTFIR